MEPVVSIQRISFFLISHVLSWSQCQRPALAWLLWMSCCLSMRSMLSSLSRIVDWMSFTVFVMSHASFDNSPTSMRVLGVGACVRCVCVCVCAHSYLCKGVNAIYIQREHIIDDPKAIRSYQTCWRSVPFAEAFLKGQNIVVSKSRILPHSFRANLSPSLIRFPCGSAILSERNEICIAAIVR